MGHFAIDCHLNSKLHDVCNDSWQIISNQTNVRKGDMKIQILCPNCDCILTDKFSSELCKLSTTKYPLIYNLEMECLKCEKNIDIEITTLSKQSGD